MLTFSFYLDAVGHCRRSGIPLERIQKLDSNTYGVSELA